MLRSILLISGFVPLIVTAQMVKTRSTKGNIKPGTVLAPTIIKTPLDSFSYAIGLNIATNLKEQGIDKVNRLMVLKAFEDIYNGEPPGIDMQTSNRIVQQKFTTIALQKTNAEKLAGLNYLNENKKKAGVITTNSGLQYQVLETGRGNIPSDSDIVKIRFTGTLINGTVIDSSAESSQPVAVQVSNTLPGWAEALKIMPVGSKWKLYVPFYLAYGDRSPGPAVPPGSTVIFDLHLLEIIKK